MVANQVFSFNLIRGDDSFGYEQLSTFWGMPSDYSTNVITNSFKNIIDAGARFGKSTANVVTGLSNIATDDMAIFNEDEDYTKYIQKLTMYTSGNKMHEKRLKDALEKDDKAELLGSFQLFGAYDGYWSEESVERDAPS